MVFVTDAMDDYDPDAHRHTMEKIFPRLGERATTGEVLKLISTRLSSAAITALAHAGFG